jgi:hypothetical protein
MNGKRRGSIASHIANLTAIFLLLMAIALSAEAVRSYFIGDLVGWRHRRTSSGWNVTTEAGVSTGNGRLVVDVRFTRKSPSFKSLLRKDSEPSAPRTWKLGTQAPEELLDLGWRDSWLGRLGFAYFHQPRRSAPDYQSSMWFFGAPLWFLACLIYPFPLLMMARKWQRRRRCYRGLCPQCGYDTRATPDRCPECGLKSRQSKNKEKGNKEKSAMAKEAGLPQNDKPNGTQTFFCHDTPQTPRDAVF